MQEKNPTAEQITGFAPLQLTVNGSMSELVSNYGQEVSKRLSEWQQETTRFVHDRLKEDLRTTQSAARCKTWQDLMAVQQQWFSKVTADYLEETQRMQKFFTQAAETTWAPVRDWLSAVMEDRQKH